MTMGYGDPGMEGGGGFAETRPVRVDPFNSLLHRYEGYYNQYNDLNDLWLSGGSNIGAELQKRGIAPDKLTDAFGASVSPWKYIENSLQETEQRMKATAQQLYGMDPNRADMAIGGLFTPAQRRELAGIPAGGEGFRPAPYQFQMTSSGRLLVFNPNTGGVSDGGEFPDAVAKQIMQDPRSGDLLAINPSSGETQVLIKGYGFPEVPPEQKFRLQVLQAAAGAESSLAGVELQQRGQIVSALGNDLATQVRIGEMQYTEANLNLNRIATAARERRAEREQVIRYGVRQSSLRTTPTGETVTRLPFADQLSALLSSATGQAFSPSDFELGVTNVNPEQVGQDIMAGSSFTSQIPGLQTARQSTLDTIMGIINRPVATGLNQRLATATQ